MADETPGEAGAGGEGGSAFNILGRIEVDLDALKKSLDKSGDMVKEHANVLQRVWSEATKVSREEVKIPGGGHGEGEGGGGGEGGARNSATAQFAHMARVVRHDLVPALSSINPQLAQFISVGAASARTAVFFGGAIGAVAVAGAVLSEIISKYVDKAKEMTAATLDSGQALATLDASRAEAGIKRLTESVAAYALASDQLTGKEGASGWQKIIAAADLAAEAVTGSLATQLASLNKYITSYNAITTRITIPRAKIDTDIAHVEVMKQDIALTIKRAQTEEELTAAYEAQRVAIARGTDDQVKKIQIDLDEKKAATDNIGAVARQAIAQSNTNKEIKASALDTLKILAQASGNVGAVAMVDAFAAKVVKAADEEVGTVREATLVLGKLEDTIANDAELSTERQKVAFDKGAAALRQSLADEIIARQRARSDTESFEQKDAQRAQTRIANEHAYAEAVAVAHDTVAALHREQLGQTESIAAAEERLARTRENTLAPLIHNLETINKLYASQKRDLEDKVATGVDALHSSKALADLEKQHAEDVAQARRKISEAEEQATAKLEEGRQQAFQKEMARRDQLLAHAVATGQVSMQDQIGAAEGGQFDPRRTRAQQEQQEEQLFSLKRQYADMYFKYQKSLGDDAWAGQLRSARSFRDETVEGSKQWFDATQRVFDLYKSIYEQAKQIAGATVGIAAGEVEREAREKEERKHPSKGPKPPEMTLANVDRYVQVARQRDEQIYAGGSARTGDVTAAMGRRDLWKEMDRTGMDFNKAFAQMQQTPEQRMMGEVGRTFSSAANTFSAAVDRFAGGGPGGGPGGRLGGGLGGVTGYGTGVIFGATNSSPVPGVGVGQETPWASAADWASRGVTAENSYSNQPQPNVDFEGMGGAVTKTKGSFESASEAVRAFVGAVLEGAAAMRRGGGNRGNSRGGVLSNNQGGNGWSSGDSSDAGRNLYLEGKRGAQSVESDI